MRTRILTEMKLYRIFASVTVLLLSVSAGIARNALTKDATDFASSSLASQRSPIMPANTSEVQNGERVAQSSIRVESVQALLCPAGPSDAYSEALRQKLISMNMCWWDNPTVQLLHRMSDAGYYFCTQKQQNRNADQQEVVQRWERTFRPVRDEVEASLDQFSVEMAQRLVCP